ncbi:hypothetical protein QYE76_028296 [Lolium multiflorum]|uniref:Uncharacterized protein n=1 Tax=Lolium multiflorum TaxID=4521 RepID=A0AAD8VH14_LOLMU|nr:hypothetical protein QYE76_028296 [Lolium multiflorum]
MVATRWSVTYTTIVNSRKKAKHKGLMVLRAEVSRIVLYDQDDCVLDVRPLHAGKLIYHGSVVHFPSHKVDVGERITTRQVINHQSTEKDNSHKEKCLEENNRDKEKSLREDNRDKEKRLGKDNIYKKKRLEEYNIYKKKRLGEDNIDMEIMDEVDGNMKNEQIPTQDP